MSGSSSAISMLGQGGYHEIERSKQLMQPGQDTSHTWMDKGGRWIPGHGQALPRIGKDKRR